MEVLTHSNHVTRVEVLVELELRRELLLRIEGELVDGERHLWEAGTNGTLRAVHGGNKLGAGIGNVGRVGKVLELWQAGWARATT